MMQTQVQMQAPEKSLEELSREYLIECAKLSLRIKELQSELARTPRFGVTWAELDRRQHNLQQMLRECREKARYLQYYYTSEARNFDLSLSNMYIKPPEK